MWGRLRVALGARRGGIAPAGSGARGVEAADPAIGDRDVEPSRLPAGDDDEAVGGAAKHDAALQRETDSRRTSSKPPRGWLAGEQRP